MKRSVGAVAVTVAALLVLAPLSVRADEPSHKVTLYTAFGGAVSAIYLPEKAAHCPPLLSTNEPIVFAPPPNGGAAICVSATKEGLDVNFLAPYASAAIDFEYPPQLSCVTLGVPTAADLMFRVLVQVDGRRHPVECDITRSFLVTLAVERQGPNSAKPIVPEPKASAWRGSILIPWAIAKLKRSHETLRVTAYANGSAQPFAAGTIEATLSGDTGALSLDYAPFLAAPAAALGSKRSQPRLHSIGADLAIAPAKEFFGAMALAQNGAATTTQRSIQQILSGAPVPIPNSYFAGLTTDTLITRAQPLVSFLSPSKALGDQDLHVLVDASPFSINKVGSLASGYAVGYGTDAVTAGAFYGVQRPGLSNQAYAVTIAVPTPEPKPTPTPAPSASPTAPQPQKQSVPPPPFARPGTVEESKTSHDPLATIALLTSVSANAGYIDSASGMAFGTNFYKNTCDTAAAYCATTFHLFGSIQNDAHPRVTAPSPAIPPFASTARVAGESGSYTRTSSGAGATPAFVQVAEMIAVQQTDRFYSPASGSITPFSPLDGSVGHLVLSYGTGLHERVYSTDFLGIRLTNAYGDVFTDAAWQLVVPIDISKRRGFSLHIGTQTETLSDRIAELQQGLASSYYSTIYPNGAALKKPVPPPVVRPQTQYDVSLDSPVLGSQKGLTIVLSGGYQAGFVTNCAPAPVLVACARGHDHAATFSVFATQKPFGFGVATTSNVSIPGDLAIASTSRYFGTYVNSPGSLTSYVTFNKWCLQASGAYANAAYPTGIPLPQRGTTVAAKIAYPFGIFGLEAGYSSTSDTQDSTQNQAGFYTQLRLNTGYGKPKEKRCA